MGLPGSILARKVTSGESLSVHGQLQDTEKQSTLTLEYNFVPVSRNIDTSKAICLRFSYWIWGRMEEVRLMQREFMIYLRPHSTIRSLNLNSIASGSTWKKRLLSSKKKYQKWYTIDALGAILQSSSIGTIDTFDNLDLLVNFDTFYKNKDLK